MIEGKLRVLIKIGMYYMWPAEREKTHLLQNNSERGKSFVERNKLK